MVASKVPVYYGSPATCAYCMNGVYPHTHGELPDESEAPAPRQRARKTQAVAVAVTTTARRGRGRPMKPENFDLLRICECE